MEKSAGKSLATLDDLVDFATGYLHEHEADPDDAVGMVHLLDCIRDSDNKVTEPTMITAFLAMFGAPSGTVDAVIATAVRLMILNFLPTAAVLVQPARGASFPEGTNMETFGAKTISDLPPDMIMDMVIIIGEDQTGQHRVKSFQLERNAEMQRVWVERPVPGVHLREANFEKLFVLPDLLKEATPGGKQRFNLTDEEVFNYIRSAAIRHFANQLLKLTPNE
jgi:hypothetical protein